MSKNIVFILTFVIPGKESRSKPYKYGIASWKHWCEKNDCELVVMDEPIMDFAELPICFQRYYAFDILENSGIDYDQICITDADAIIHPECPNFFELTDRKWTVTHTDASYDWVCRSMENYAHEFDEFNKFPIWEYFNGGFQVFNKTHRPIITKFLEFYWENKDKILHLQQTYGVGTDQPMINHFTQKNKVEKKYLPYRYCMVDLNLKGLLTDDLLFTEIKGIYQFNAIPNNGDARYTNYFMEKTYNKLYEI